jgi:hypothetical protein
MSPPSDDYHPSHVQILAARRLDAVDFAPILTELKPLLEVAHQLAATGAPELVFQFTDRWTDLENVLAASGLTANAAWMYDLENENSRQRHEAWEYLRGFLLDVRTKYAPQDLANHDVIAKRLAVAVEKVQKVPRQARMEAESGGGQRGKRQEDELPWAGPEWDELAPLLRRLLRHMHGKNADEIANFTDKVWEKNEVSPSSIHAAISRANDFLRKQNYPRLLSKVRSELIVRWV